MYLDNGISSKFRLKMGIALSLQDPDIWFENQSNINFMIIRAKSLSDLQIFIEPVFP